jgi:hypothetical protein
MEGKKESLKNIFQKDFFGSFVLSHAAGVPSLECETLYFVCVIFWLFYDKVSRPLPPIDALKTIYPCSTLP